jgi:hypothetical protein
MQCGEFELFINGVFAVLEDLRVTAFDSARTLRVEGQNADRVSGWLASCASNSRQA